MATRVVHKRTEGILWGHLCGKQAFISEGDYKNICCNRKWSKVTCKNCLKKK